MTREEREAALRDDPPPEHSETGFKIRNMTGAQYAATLASSKKPRSAHMCEGTSKQCGLPCRQKKAKGSRFCRHHGGHHSKGISAPSFKNGKTSKYAPAGILEEFTAAMEDRQLLSLRQDIALLHARIQQLIKRLNSGESGSLWSDLKDAYLDLRSAFNEDDESLQESCLQIIHGIIHAGIQEEAIWKAVTDAIEKKSQLISREWRMMVDMHQVLTIEEAMSLVGRIILSVKEHVHDHGVLTSISNDIAGVLASKSDFAANKDSKVVLERIEQK